MSDGLRPRPPIVRNNVVNRLKGASSTQLFAALLAFMGVVNIFLQLPYGYFLLFLSLLLVVSARLGALLAVIVSIGIYATSVDLDSNPAMPDYINCAVENWEEIGECRDRAESDYLMAVDLAGIEHKFYVLMHKLEMPYAAFYFGASYRATAELQVLADGKLRVTSLESEASDLKPLFDNEILNYLNKSFWIKTESERVSFPATTSITLPFTMLDDDVNWLRVALEKLVFFVLVFFAAGFMLGHHNNLANYCANIAAPTGIYLSSFYACLTVSSYATTNYQMLGEGLLTGAVFLGLGAFCSFWKATKVPAGKQTPMNPLGYLLLIFLPVIGLSHRFTDPALQIWLEGEHQLVWDGLFLFKSVFNTYAVGALVTVGVLIAFFGGQFSTRRKLDILITISTALVTVSIVFWFLSMGAITEDYVALFPVLQVAATGFVCTSLLFTLMVLAADKPIPKLALQRRVVLLLEVFTFFLFFAYAPASVSQLGQQFEQQTKENEEKVNLEERLKIIEELLDIEPIESDEID